MNITQATNILEDFNKWRRGAEMGQPNSKTIGEAIDCVVNYHKTERRQLLEHFVDFIDNETMGTATTMGYEYVEEYLNQNP